ncbi:hypothetical protein O181_063752 [Austropuccinia psidii MF-1]|uniref:Uncharacterized protein n=1 Tax=Austropuccinia psidii MF-1 TaxID=1389203 RepID=A0A9Q3I1N7_9BASI|nr:hypothetical protein [Austropuccinia psidii MF-1]
MDPGTPNRPTGRIPDNWPCPTSTDLSTPLLGHHPMVTSLLNRSKVIIRPMKDGNGERKFELGPIVTMSCHPWDSDAKKKTHRIPPTRLTRSMYASQANPMATHSWPKWHPMVGGLIPTLPHGEPPIPGPSPSSKPPEDILTCEPEPEVAPTQSMGELFGKSQLHFFNSSQLLLTPPLPISSLSHYSLLNHHHQRYPRRIPPPIPPFPTPPPSTPVPPPSTSTPDLPPIATENPTVSSPRCQAPLIPTRTLAGNSQTCNQH